MNEGVAPSLAHYSTTPGLHYSVPIGLERPAKILEAIEAFLNYIDAGGVTEPHGAIVPEGNAGHDCDVCLT